MIGELLWVVHTVRSVRAGRGNNKQLPVIGELLWVVHTVRSVRAGRGNNKQLPVTGELLWVVHIARSVLLWVVHTVRSVGAGRGNNKQLPVIRELWVIVLWVTDDGVEMQTSVWVDNDWVTLITLHHHAVQYHNTQTLHSNSLICVPSVLPFILTTNWQACEWLANVWLVDLKGN